MWISSVRMATSPVDGRTLCRTRYSTPLPLCTISTTAARRTSFSLTRTRKSTFCTYQYCHPSPPGFIAANGSIPRDLLAPRPVHPPPMVRAPLRPLEPPQLLLLRPSSPLHTAPPSTNPRLPFNLTDTKRFQHRRSHAAAQNPKGETPPTRKTHLHRARSAHSSQCRAFHRRRTTRLNAPRLLLSQRTRLPRGNTRNRARKVDLRGNCNADISPAASPRWI